MPRPSSHRTRSSLTFLRTATITAATAIAIVGVLVISNSEEDTPAAGEEHRSPNWPGGDSSLSVLPSTSQSTTTGPTSTTTAPPSTTSAPPSSGGDTPPPNNGPAPNPTTAPPTNTQPQPQPDPGPPVPGAPCANPGEVGYTEDGEGVLCMADPGTGQPTWHLGPE
jgi:hypothetical protein